MIIRLWNTVELIFDFVLGTAVCRTDVFDFWALVLQPGTLRKFEELGRWTVAAVWGRDKVIFLVGEISETVTVVGFCSGRDEKATEKS